MREKTSNRPTSTIAGIEPELDRKKQFAQRTSVSVRCIDNWIREKRIPFLKVGGAVLIPWRDAIATLNRDYRSNARE